MRRREDNYRRTAAGYYILNKVILQEVRMQRYIMALDQGTTSSRCILFDKRGNICSMAQKEFTQIYPQAGWVEHNPREIWASQLAVAIEAMAGIGADASCLAGIGITNQREAAMKRYGRRPGWCLTLIFQEARLPGFWIMWKGRGRERSAENYCSARWIPG